MHLKRKAYMNGKIVLIMFCIVFITSVASAELKLESVYPTLGVLGQDLSVTLTGSGFDENTRVSMSLDTGHRTAIIGSIDTPGDARGVTVVGDTAYVANGSSGLQIIDVSNPASPTLIGSVDTPGSVREVTVIGDTAYVAEGGGLQIINVSNPVSPILIGFVDTPGYAQGVTVVENTAYVVDWSGLQIIDVSNPPMCQGRCRLN